jgi:hypothetical protein
MRADSPTPTPTLSMRGSRHCCSAHEQYRRRLPRNGLTRALRLCALPLLLAVLPLSARATEGKTAEELIKLGLQLRREGNPTEALEMFQRAHALFPSPRTIGHQGLVEGTLEHWVDAERHLTDALTVVSDPWVRKNRSILEQALLTVQEHIGEVQVSGTGNAAITIAGKLVGRLPIAPVRLAVGTVLVSAAEPGWQPAFERVTVLPGMRTHVTFVLEPIYDRPTPNPPRREPTPTPFLRHIEPHSSSKTRAGGSTLAAGTVSAAPGSVALGGHF